MTPDPTLDAEVRRVDEDRWLASRFAPAHVRARLIAIYALNAEIAKTADVVTQAPIGDIRLAWWRDAIAEVHADDIHTCHESLRHHVVSGHTPTQGFMDFGLDLRYKTIVQVITHLLQQIGER